MSFLSSRLKSIKPSPTLAVASKARELKENGIDIISLAAGEPSYDTPDNVKSAAIKAIKNGFTKYTNVSGMPELKQAICDKFKNDRNIEYKTNEIIVSNGGKQVIYNLFMATINPSDEVIIPIPYWASYPDMVNLAGGKVIIIHSDIDTKFKINPTDLENAITKKTKWLILNSPNNPSGMTYDQYELEDIANVIRKYPDLHILCDDIYEYITFDNFKFYSLLEIAPDLKERVFITSGVSKTYSMTGWRIGYGLGSEKIIKAMSIIQSQSTSNPCSISQFASVEAISGDQKFIKDNIKSLEKKRDLALSLMGKINGIEVCKPQGTFYLFPKCSAFFGKKTPDGRIIKGSSDLATYLLDKANIAVVPGIAFGSDECFRMSYTLKEELLITTCNRMSEALSMIR